MGATDGRYPLMAPATSFQAHTDQAPDTSDERHRNRADLASARLLETARKDRADGHPEIAQRVLEVLIARYPDSPYADTARRELYEIYAANRNVAGSAKAPRPARASPPPSVPPAPVDVTPAAGTPVPSWRTSVVNYRRMQDEFRNAVGDRVFFGDGSAELGSRARAVIAAQAAWLTARPEVDAVIEGHSDDQLGGGGPEHLSRLRAIAVRDRLIADGVEADHLMIAVHGARDPVAVCSDTACAAQNRRAILQLTLRNPSGTSGNSGTRSLPDAAPAIRRR